jgi:hypothetical protein
MRREHQITLLCAISALPLWLASLSAATYFQIPQEYVGLTFWGGLALTLILWGIAIVIALRGEATASRRGRKRRMTALAGMIACGVGFIVFAGIYFWPRFAEPARPDITWSFDNNPSAYFLGMSGGPEAAGVVSSFQATGHNNLETLIERVSGYLLVDRNNNKYPLYLVINGTIVKPEETNGIPPGADFTIAIPFYIQNRQEQYIEALKFLSDFPPFTFVFEYDGNTYKRRFTRDEVKLLIMRFADDINRSNKPAVTKK